MFGRRRSCSSFLHDASKRDSGVGACVCVFHSSGCTLFAFEKEKKMNFMCTLCCFCLHWCRRAWTLFGDDVFVPLPTALNGGQCTAGKAARHTAATRRESLALDAFACDACERSQHTSRHKSGSNVVRGQEPTQSPGHCWKTCTSAKRLPYFLILFVFFFACVCSVFIVSSPPPPLFPNRFSPPTNTHTPHHPPAFSLSDCCSHGYFHSSKECAKTHALRAKKESVHADSAHREERLCTLSYYFLSLAAPLPSSYSSTSGGAAFNGTTYL